MITAVDTNVIVALWDRSDALSSAAQTALDKAFEQGPLVVPPPVFAELLAFPGRSETFVDSFFHDTGISIDWTLDEGVWRSAGRAFQGYAARRRAHSGPAPRRILADFLIGAYALHKGYRLLTLDHGLYRAAFPSIRVLTI